MCCLVQTWQYPLPATPATGEVGQRMTSGGQPGKSYLRVYFFKKKNINKRARSMVQVVKQLPSLQEALGLRFNTHY
jgi:hypothetical protein